LLDRHVLVNHVRCADAGCGGFRWYAMRKLPRRFLYLQSYRAPVWHRAVGEPGAAVNPCALARALDSRAARQRMVQARKWDWREILIDLGLKISCLDNHPKRCSRWKCYTEYELAGSVPLRVETRQQTISGFSTSLPGGNQPIH